MLLVESFLAKKYTHNTKIQSTVLNDIGRVSSKDGGSHQYQRCLITRIYSILGVLFPSSVAAVLTITNMLPTSRPHVSRFRKHNLFNKYMVRSIFHSLKEDKELMKLKMKENEDVRLNGKNYVLEYKNEIFGKSSLLLIQQK